MTQSLFNQPVFGQDKTESYSCCKEKRILGKESLTLHERPQSARYWLLLWDWRGHTQEIERRK